MSEHVGEINLLVPAPSLSSETVQGLVYLEDPLWVDLDMCLAGVDL